jgi:hypothetical protein
LTSQNIQMKSVDANAAVNTCCAILSRHGKGYFS